MPRETMTSAVIYHSPSEKYPDQDLSVEDRQIMEEVRKALPTGYQTSCRTQDNKYLFTASLEGKIEWYDNANGLIKIQSMHLYEETTFQVTFRYMKLSEDENTLYAGFADKTIQIWKKEQGRFQKSKTFYATF